MFIPVWLLLLWFSFYLFSLSKTIDKDSRKWDSEDMEKNYWNAVEEDEKNSFV